MKKTAVIWFTSAGAELAERVGHLPELDILEYRREAKPAKDFVREAFSQCDQILFISAVGIAGAELGTASLGFNLSNT